MDRHAAVMCNLMGNGVMDSAIDEQESKKPSPLADWQLTGKLREFIESLIEDAELTEVCPVRLSSRIHTKILLFRLHLNPTH
ncbi:hypothetical protein NG99_01115 [Erwinia typographi]|uniref:Uncharacterized protein n=1 Tax=Erwinia typographi TaxID=371042 RepID=A0A0A3ZDN8_9GAMM|nr:hypothetical protein NG99_01115 [Erwinia typographi]